METSIIQFEIPSNLDLERLAPINYTELRTGFQRHFHDSLAGNIEFTSDTYGLITLTIWIIIVFTFFTITIVFCICSCLFYNKIRKWNQNAQARRNYENSDETFSCCHDDLPPSYTLVSGLPLYDAALEQWNKSIANTRPSDAQHPSVFQIFQTKPSSSIAEVNVNQDMPSDDSAVAHKLLDAEMDNHFASAINCTFESEKENFCSRSERLTKFLARLQPQISTVEATVLDIKTDDADTEKSTCS